MEAVSQQVLEHHANLWKPHQLIARKARDVSVPWQDVVGLRNIPVHEYFAFIGRWYGKKIAAILDT